MLDEAAALAFERPSDDEPFDETDISLRAYATRIPEEKLREYEPSWSDEQVIEWDDNFRDDGDLMLVCCERDVDVKEYRKVLEEFVQYRSGFAQTAEA